MELKKVDSWDVRMAGLEGFTEIVKTNCKERAER
jgi:hypothetical protein